MKRRITTLIIGTNWLFLEYVSFNSHLSFCHQTEPMQSTIPHTSLVTFVWYDDTDTIHLQWKWEEVLKVIKSNQKKNWYFSVKYQQQTEGQFDSENETAKIPSKNPNPKNKIQFWNSRTIHQETKPRWVGGSLALPDGFSLFKKLSSTLNRPNIKQVNNQFAAN